METMKVYHLTIQENGHSRRFVYEDRDEALKRLADATAAGHDLRSPFAGILYEAFHSRDPAGVAERTHLHSFGKAIANLRGGHLVGEAR